MSDGKTEFATTAEAMAPTATTEDWSGPKTHEEARMYHQGFIAGLTAYAREKGDSTLKSENHILRGLMHSQGFATLEVFEKLSVERGAGEKTAVGETAAEFFLRAVGIGGRVVSSNDLNEWQISEARVKGLFWISEEGFGWAILPWELTTDRDRNRERSFFAKNVGGFDDARG